MSIHNYWRNKQLGQNLAQQEIICFEWLKQQTGIQWQWYGHPGYFQNYCRERLDFSQPATGLVIVNYPLHATPAKFVDTINRLVTDRVQAVYLAINRFEFNSKNDLNLDWPDSMEQSIDLIVAQCKIPLRRLQTFAEVDALHFVGIHGLDIFVYAKDR